MALLTFEEELDGVDTFVDLVESVLDLRTKSAAVPKVMHRSPFGRAAVDVSVSAAVRPARWDVLALDGCVLSIAGMFEEYVRATVRALVQEVGNKAPSFDDLASDVWAANIKGIGTYLSRWGQARFEHMDIQLVVSDLFSTLGRAGPVRLFGDGFVIHDRNFGNEVLAEVVGRVGLKQLWVQLGQERTLQNHFGLTQANLTASAARSKLDGFMETRNGIAHRASSYQTVGPSLIRDYVAFFRALSASLVGVFVAWLASL